MSLCFISVRFKLTHRSIIKPASFQGLHNANNLVYCAQECTLKRSYNDYQTTLLYNLPEPENVLLG